jgi:Flp pilus assembly protein TadD
MVRQAVRALTPSWRVPRDRARFIEGLTRSGPVSLVATAVLFNLLVLRGETMQVPNLNDGALHMSMMRVALHDIEHGQLPFGRWFPYLSLGSAQFLHYQSFPHVIGALVATVFGTSNVYYWSLYLLLALWPISVYAGARLLGWNRWIAAAAAVLSPLLVSTPGYGYEDASYTWSGFGVWTQLWGMWLLPLAWGLSWRAVNRGKSYALAGLAIAITIACHFLTGYLALLVLVPWVLVDLPRVRRRLIRAAVVGGGALLIASWVLVPLVTHAAWSGNLQYYKGSFYFDSYGATQVLGWLFTGQIYDSGRFPIVTLLVALGLVVCAVRMRTDTRARALVAAWALSLVLYFGRPTLGPLLNILPGSSDLPLHRYINGIQLAGLMLAGVGSMWLVRMLIRGLRRAAPRANVVAMSAAIAVAGLALLFPAWSQLAAYNANGAQLMSAQQQADATDGADLSVLINMVRAAGDGRAYAGTKGNWGHEYTIGDRPVYLELENADVDAIGSWLNTESISSDAEANFDERNLADYELFNIKYLILPQDHPPPVPARLLAHSGRHTLWEVATSGYLEVVDTIAPAIVEDRNDVGPQTAGFMESNALQQLQFPTVAFDGAQAAPPTLTGAVTHSTPAGSVGSQTAALDDGVFSGRVTANRSAVVLLKTTYEPGWQVTVDGASAQPIMVAPTFVGVAVTPGTHTVVFSFAAYPYYPELLALGLITFLALALVPGRLTASGVAMTDERAAPSTQAPRAVRIRTTRGIPRFGRWHRPTATRLAIAPLVVATVLALAIAGIVNLTTSQPDSVQAAAYISAGVTAQSEGRISDAREDYRQALAHDPRNKFAYFNLGTIESQQGNASLAIDDYETALASDANFVPALYNLAVALTASNPSEAVSLYQRVVQADPTNADAHLNLGFLFHRLGEDGAAKTEFAAAMRLDPNLASRIPATLRPSS